MMFPSLNFILKKLKWVAVAVAIFAIGFVLLNFNYFAKQLGFYIDQTLVTDQQRSEQVAQQSAQLDPNSLYIPSMNVRAPIVYVAPENSNEAEFQKALQNGVVHYPNTAPVGEAGNSYIFGHSSDFAFSAGNYKTVFALLPNIENGAEIWVSNEAGEIFKYKVYEKFVAKKTDVQLLNQNTNGKAILTLQTSYPIGTALQRYIVKAELFK